MKFLVLGKQRVQKVFFAEILFGVIFTILGFLSVQSVEALEQGSIFAKKDWQDIKIPALPPITLQEPIRIQLENGLIIFLQADHELPLIQTSIVIRGGSEEEPPAKVGLVGLYAETWISGGTKTQNGDQLNDFFASRGIEVKAIWDINYTLLRFHCLKTDFEQTKERVFSLLWQPEFREDKLALMKKQKLTSLAIEKDDPRFLASREAKKIAFGREHPFARTPNYSTIQSVKRADLLAWHQKHVHPNQIMIGVLGDFDPKEMEKNLRKSFEHWPKGPEYQEPKLSFAQTKPGLYFVPKEDVTQTNIRFIQLGQMKKNPDFYGIELLNQILGNSPLSSRLAESIRLKQGLAYDIMGGIDSGWITPSMYFISLGTDNKNTVRAIEAIYQELEDLLNHPPSKEEIQMAKDQILHSFIFNFKDKASVLYDRITLEFFRYPPNWTQKYPEEIQKLTEKDIIRVIQKYLNPKGFSVLVVGKEKDFDKPLSSLNMGQIQVINPSVQITPKKMNGAGLKK